MQISRQKKAHPRLEVSSLLDCIFLLLIFFMLTARMSQPSIPVQLPEGADQGERQTNAILLTVAADGSFSLNGQETDEVGLPLLLSAQLHLATTPPVVVIQGDQQAPYGRVFQALQLARESGAPAVEVAYDPGKE